MAFNPLEYEYTNITGQATTLCATGKGRLHAITFNKPVATATVTIYDQTSATGNKIGTITVPSSPQPVTVFYNAKFALGLTVVTGVADEDITVLWAQG